MEAVRSWGRSLTNGSVSHKGPQSARSSLQHVRTRQPSLSQASGLPTHPTCRHPDRVGDVSGWERDRAAEGEAGPSCEVPCAVSLSVFSGQHVR